MFQKGDHVICGASGICSVESITTMRMPGADEKEYYLLKPVFSPQSTVYIPVNHPEGSLRKALTKEEALALIDEIPSLPEIKIPDEKKLEYIYKEYLLSNNISRLVMLVKTIYKRREMRIRKGNKSTALDNRYFKQAEEFIHGELAVALSIPKDQVRDFISENTQMIIEDA